MLSVSSQSNLLFLNLSLLVSEQINICSIVEVLLIHKKVNKEKVNKKMYVQIFEVRSHVTQELQEIGV